MNPDLVKILPWSEKSRGALELRKSLGIKALRLQGSKYLGSKNHTVINWGCSKYPPEISDKVKLGRVVNPKERVAICSDKLRFFNAMSKPGGPRIPKYTESLQEAVEWHKSGETVLARTTLKGNSGKGIVFFDDVLEFVEAKLYTVYKKKKEEYRIHFAFGNDIAIQQKVLRKTDDKGNVIDPKNVDFRVRSFKNGFIFQRHGLHTPNDVIVQAQLAYKLSGLDFGAVDVIWNETESSAYVLEINTAPGIEGETVLDYTKAMKEDL